MWEEGKKDFRQTGEENYLEVKGLSSLRTLCPSSFYGHSFRGLLLVVVQRPVVTPVFPL